MIYLYEDIFFFLDGIILRESVFKISVYFHIFDTISSNNLFIIDRVIYNRKTIKINYFISEKFYLVLL